jgi:hypothetical protein
VLVSTPQHSLLACTIQHSRTRHVIHEL